MRCDSEIIERNDAEVCAVLTTNVVSEAVALTQIDILFAASELCVRVAFNLDLPVADCRASKTTVNVPFNSKLT